MEFRIKKSQFSVKSRFKESKCADEGHSLNGDFTVYLMLKHSLVSTEVENSKNGIYKEDKDSCAADKTLRKKRKKE